MDLGATSDKNHQGPASGRGGRVMDAGTVCAHACWRLCQLGIRACLAAVMLALLAAGAGWLVLRSGPVELPAVAGMVEDEVNAGQPEVRISVGSVLLGLGRRAGQPALRFRDVELRAPDGGLLLAVPEIGARFHLGDLIGGQLRVTELLLRGPTARVVREADGRWRLGLGTGEGMTLTRPATAPAADAHAVQARPAPADGAPAADPAPQGTLAAEIAARDPAEGGFLVVSEILDSLAGGGAPVPELARLNGVLIRDAALTYVNAATGDSWSSEGATLRVRRDADGLTGALGLQLAEDPAAPVRTIRVAIHRERGRAGTEIDASLNGVRPARLAGAVPELDWLGLIDAPIDATLAGRLGDDGRLGAVSGEIHAGAGRFVDADGAAFGASAFDSLRLAFDYDPLAERLALAAMEVEAAAGTASLAGFLDLERGGDGALAGLVGQLGIRDVRLDLPEVFAAPLVFDGGEIVARVGLEPATVEIASARLGRGAFSVDLSGRLARGSSGWESDLRAEGRNLEVAGLKAYWPVSAARNARNWVVEHIESGMIDDLVAQVRLGRGEPQVSLDFAFRNVVSRYLGTMPAIRDARGRGHLRLDDFMLAMDAGQVGPIGGEMIALDGSSLHISDLWARQTLADIALHGQGPLGAVLALIDHEPLSLVSKLGLDPAAFGGQADVATRLNFPLISRLRLDEVEADAKAAIRDLAMTLGAEGEPPLSIAGAEVDLVASTSELSVRGDVTADGVPMAVDWREVYGTTPGRREVVLRGRATPELLARVGGSVPGFEAGSAAILARISQVGREPPAARIEADLADARLALPRIGWEKAVGRPGRLAAEAVRAADGAVDITALDLDTPGLAARGSLSLDPAGELIRATFDEIRLGDRADVAVAATRLGADGLAITVRGRRLDLGAFDDAFSPSGGAAAGDAEGQPAGAPQLAVEFDISEVVLTPEIAIASARGRADTTADGAIRVEAGGSLNGEAPVSVTLSLPPGAAGQFDLEAPDAGAFLRATELAATARDGHLTLSAQLEDGGFERFSGTVRMTDITLREARMVEGILARGGMAQTLSGGLAFSDIRIPFDYDTGVITLGTSIASGPALAIKVDGTIEQESRKLDLSGVISPAYALTGALDNIPLLGALLSGGKGEGILAMTFVVGGTIEDPSYTVNPLSLLTPGILRRIFSSKTREPDGRFLEGLDRGN